jgi:N-acetylglucosamine-6-phosphate deacetylase
VLKVPLTDALTVATLTPARLLGVDDRIGRLKPCFRANLVHLTTIFRWSRCGPADARLNEIDAAA